MTNSLYDFGRESFAKADIDWPDDTIKAVLVDTDDYTVDLAADQYLDDVPAGARVATATLQNPTCTDGILDADDLTFASVSGDQSEALVIYKDTGVEGTSILIAYVDTATGLPITPDGNNIIVAWDAGSDKIAKL